MAKLDYVKTILYGILLTMLSCVITLVSTMLITKSPDLALTLCAVIPVVLLSAYLIIVIRIPDKVGFCTEEDQKHWQVKLIFGISILLYMVISLGIFYMISQFVGKCMLFATPIFLVIGKVIDLIIKKKNSKNS